MANISITLNDEFKQNVRDLARYVEEGNETEADRLLDKIAKSRESSLFQELGKLTREFHEALNSFRLDSRILSLTEQDFPDARERLRYVVQMTAQSADRSLTAAEESMPIVSAIEARADALKSQWSRFMHREMSATEFRELSAELHTFLGELSENSSQLKERMTEVIMAQDFQDLTGQIIERVITLVDDMERSLVDLIRISGQDLAAKEATNKAPKDHLKGVGPAVPGVDEASNLVSGQDEVDDLLSSLGF
ncbi:MAG: protein phosphatase CheZ [Gammaproteobacteria bacterium]|nr:protein phosphatase CheZ [Gammaproteobacteria bacterium]